MNRFAVFMLLAGIALASSEAHGRPGPKRKEVKRSVAPAKRPVPTYSEDRCEEKNATHVWYTIQLDARRQPKRNAQGGVIRCYWDEPPRGFWAYPTFARVYKRPVTSGAGARVHPVTGKNNTHTGIDLAAKVGMPTFSPRNGVVIETGNQAVMGNYVKVLIYDKVNGHDIPLIHAFLHLSEILVETGDVVRRGDLIARTGNTGRGTGPHLHWAVRVQNPDDIKYFPDHARISGDPVYVNPPYWLDRMAYLDQQDTVALR